MTTVPQQRRQSVFVSCDGAGVSCDKPVAPVRFVGYTTITYVQTGQCDVFDVLHFGTPCDTKRTALMQPPASYFRVLLGVGLVILL